MSSPITVTASSHPRAALLSALVPGLGQASRGRGRQAAVSFLVSAALLAGTWALGRAAGAGAALFFAFMVVLPWWVLQSYEAFLPDAAGWRQTVAVVWARAHDIRYLGALFLLTAVTDLSIIVANPAYALTVFCNKPEGVLGILAKAQSPTLHTLIGYGFLRLRRWALFLYMVYAAFGLLNATANFACFGYGRIRTVFLLTLAGFTIFVLWRRRCFEPPERRLASPL
ncbi:hypothetical protein [Nitrospira sp. Kam-Ns4a]